MKLIQRFDKDLYNDITERRMKYAVDQLLSLGLDLNIKSTNGKDNVILFLWRGSQISFWPYSGWATGKTIKDCRGIKNLIDQLK